MGFSEINYAISAQRNMMPPLKIGKFIYNSEDKHGYYIYIERERERDKDTLLDLISLL